MVQCAKCNGELGDHKKSVAQITLEVIGNEHSHGYWFCKSCDVYSRMRWIDIFLGPEETFGPTLIEKKQGDKIVALIKKCPDPTEKRCSCEAHTKLV